MGDTEIKISLDSKLQIFSICSVEILNILEVIVKNRKISNPALLKFYDSRGSTRVEGAQEGVGLLTDHRPSQDGVSTEK